MLDLMNEPSFQAAVGSVLASTWLTSARCRVDVAYVLHTPLFKELGGHGSPAGLGSHDLALS